MVSSFTYLKDVKPYKTSWKIQVKVLHSWKQYTTQAGETLELILADETGVKIHCSCKKTWLQRVEKELPVGAWKVIENFSLPATGNFRLTTHVYKMTFVSTTSIFRSLLKSEDNFLSLTSFDQITSGNLKTHFLIDVIGQVLDMGELETVQVGGKGKKKVEFRLRDIEDERLKCCLWGKFAEQLTTYCQGAGEAMVICLLRFAKINFYQGELQITNAYDSSSLLINAPIPEVEQFKNKLPQDGLALTIIDTNDEKLELMINEEREKWSRLPKKSVAELLNAPEVEKCKVMCTISAIDTDFGWYYFGYCKCNRRVQIVKTNDAIVKSKTKITTPTFTLSMINKFVFS